MITMNNISVLLLPSSQWWCFNCGECCIWYYSLCGVGGARRLAHWGLKQWSCFIIFVIIIIIFFFFSSSSFSFSSLFSFSSFCSSFSFSSPPFSFPSFFCSSSFSFPFPPFPPSSSSSSLLTYFLNTLPLFPAGKMLHKKIVFSFLFFLFFCPRSSSALQPYMVKCRLLWPKTRKRGRMQRKRNNLTDRENQGRPEKTDGVSAASQRRKRPKS